jgi:hypothetical protein
VLGHYPNRAGSRRGPESCRSNPTSSPATCRPMGLCCPLTTTLAMVGWTCPLRIQPFIHSFPRHRRLAIPGKALLVGHFPVNLGQA